MIGVGPEFLQHRGIQIRAVGHHDRGVQAPSLEVPEEPLHVVLVVGGDQGEGHGQVAQRVGGQQQGEATQVQFVDAQRAAEVLQDHTAMLGHVKRFGVAVEDVIDEPRGQVEEVFTAQRLHRLFHVHRVLEDAIEHQVANLVIVEGSGEDVLGSVPEGLAAAAPGLIFAAEDLEEGDGLVDDGANPAWRELAFATAVFAALRAWGLLGGAVDRYNNGCGDFGAHGLHLRWWGLRTTPIHQDAGPIYQEQNDLAPPALSVVMSEKSRKKWIAPESSLPQRSLSLW